MMILDALGNNLACGDVVVTAMASRHSGNIRTGYIIQMLDEFLVIETDRSKITRRPNEVVKAVTP
jgi:hypothetical protein